MTITLNRDEAIEILEDIARNAQNAAARIAAIKQLEEMRNGEQETDSDFSRLDEGAPKRNFRLKAA